MVRIALLPSKQKAAALALAKELVPLISQLNFELAIDDEYAKECSLMPLSSCPEIDYLLILGGDGSFISEARKHLHREIPFIGMNLGHLGYLTDLSVSGALYDFKQLLEGHITIEERLTLSCSFKDPELSLSAINDIVLHRGFNPGIIEISVYSKEELICNYIADGLIVSSPTGSTAYSLSAGGPIIDPTIEAFVLTAICPQSLAYRPIVIRSDTLLEVQYLSSHKSALLSVDGHEHREINPLQTVSIAKGPTPIKVVRFKDKNPWKTMRAKLGVGSIYPRESSY